MARCDTCGNDYARTFEVRQGEDVFTFDSIECAAEKIAPACEGCGCRILGHGVQEGDRMFCCAHCARERGVEGLRDQMSSAA